MPKYTTVSNMLIMMPNVMSRSNVTSAQLAYFIDAAEGLVDGYIAKRYTIPISTPVPRLVETISTQISIYELLSKRLFAGEVAAESQWVASYKEAVEQLKDIARGRIALVSSDGTLLTGEGNLETWSSTDDYLPTFTEDSPLLQHQDPDKIDDIRQERGNYPSVYLTHE